jgi:alpha-D-ribose 1-methylphosphonate 5-triphosphate synthase subunit PhnI
MIDTHWLDNPRSIEVNHNDTTEALFMLHDLRTVLSDKVKNQPLDDSDDTVGEAIDHVIEFIEQLDHKCTEVAP